MSSAEDKVEAKIREKKVVVISKSSCPFCARTKDLFKGYMGKGPQALKRADYGVWELGYGPETRDIQDYLKRKTGKSTVSRYEIFIVLAWLVRLFGCPSSNFDSPLADVILNLDGPFSSQYRITDSTLRRDAKCLGATIKHSNSIFIFAAVTQVIKKFTNNRSSNNLLKNIPDDLY